MEREDLKALKAATSDTLCLAKFHTATLRLFAEDISTGCFHNPFTPTGVTVDTFFNPPKKREEQHQMLEGEKPQGCSYCWNIESHGLDSDRLFFSLNVKKPEPVKFYKNRDSVFKPKYLEVSFQRTCNFACSYCGPEFSTAWGNDIRINGQYKLSENFHFNIVPKNVQAQPKTLSLFWEWFDTVIDDLETLRITGGEPLLHKELFDVLEIAIKRNPSIEVVVNSNLVNSRTVIDRFVDNIQQFTNSIVYTSNEAVGEVSEFIRDGMNYIEWINNIKLIAPHVKFLCVMATPNAVSLQSFHLLIRDIFKLRSEGFKVMFSVNLLRHPEFQSFECLTETEKLKYYNLYSDLLAEQESNFKGKEIEHLKRLIAELKKPQSEFQEKHRKDLTDFFEQFTIRRGKQINYVHTI